MDNREQEIIVAIRDRDKRVFEQLYKEHYRQLFALAFRYVKQAPAAEEIVHDVFLTIWSKAAQLSIQYSLKSYLCRAVVNSSLNFIKKQKAELLKQEAFAKLNDEEVADEDQDPQEVLLMKLEKALELLPPKCREVMYLSRFGKLKQQEIADQLQISVKTVKNHITYGFQRLREELGSHHNHLSFWMMIVLKYWVK